MTVARFSLLVLLLQGLSRPVQGVPLSIEESALVDAAMTAEIERQKAIGVAVGVIREGEIVYAKGYGFADREEKIPVTTKTMFRWASISKPLTAVVAMQLVEAGKLDLDDDVRRHVPEFPDKGVRITVRQLLSHQGGVVHYSNGKVIQTEREYESRHPYENVVVALDTFKESPLVHAPGEKYSYSTHGYILLSAVVERAGKLRFAEQVQKRVCAPLGLESLQPDYQWVNIPHRAAGYRLRDGQVVRSTDTDVSWKLGGGGYISTIEDLARFGIGLMERRLVNGKTERLMWTVRQPSIGPPTKYALGFSVEGQGGNLKISHNGSQEKARTRLVIYPRQRHGMVVMSNSRHADPGRFTTEVYRALSGR